MENVLGLILDLTIKLHLAVHQIDNSVNNLVARDSEIFRCGIVRIYQARDGLGEERLAPRSILHEVKEEYVIKVAMHLLIIMEVKIVVQFREFQHNLDSLRLIITWQTSMLLAFENAIAALEDKVWADGVLLSI